MCYKPICILACPDGFTPIEGYIPGHGLIKYDNTSLQRCSEYCNDYQNETIDVMSDCHGFEHNEPRQSCKLVSQLQPHVPQIPQDKDVSQFCSRIGK